MSNRTDVWPVLHFDDTNGALQFLSDALGFEAGAVVSDDEGRVVHAEMGLPDGGFLVFGYAGRGEGVHSSLPTGCAATYIATDQVDSAHRRARDAGAEIVRPPHETSFGTGVPTRAFTLRDPEGNLWTFGDYRGVTE